MTLNTHTKILNRCHIPPPPGCSAGIAELQIGRHECEKCPMWVNKEARKWSSKERVMITTEIIQREI